MSEPNKAVISINAKFAEEVARAMVAKGHQVKPILQAGMRAVLEGNWLERNPHHLFMAALAGVMHAYGIEHPESVRIVESAKRINVYEMYLHAMSQGIKCEPPDNAPADHLQLLSMWMEVLAQFKAERPHLFSRIQAG